MIYWCKHKVVWMSFHGYTGFSINNDAIDEILSRSAVCYPKECVEHLSNEFQLTEEEKSSLMANGQTPVFYNRVALAWERLKVLDCLMVKLVVFGV